MRALLRFVARGGPWTSVHLNLPSHERGQRSWPWEREQWLSEAAPLLPRWTSPRGAALAVMRRLCVHSRMLIQSFTYMFLQTPWAPPRPGRRGWAGDGRGVAFPGLLQGDAVLNALLWVSRQRRHHLVPPELL